MLKKIGVLAITLASFGALIPATASAAERGREETRVVVQKRDDRRPVHVDEHRVIARRMPVRYYATAPKCR